MVIRTVAIGHMCIDVIVHGVNIKRGIGGSVVYSSLASLKHDAKPLIISKVGSDFPDEYLLWLGRVGVDISGVRVVSSPTTKFKLMYRNGTRTLYLLSRCDDIFPEDVSENLVKNAVVLVGSIAGEVPLATLQKVSTIAELVAMDIQGFIRSVDQDGKVLLKPFPVALKSLQYADIVHAEAEEASTLLGIEDPVKAGKAMVEMGAGIALITLGADGAYLVTKKSSIYVPPLEAKSIDRTGCGDVFTAVFAIEYQRTGDIKFAGAMASAAAGLLTEGVGISGLRPRWIVKKHALSLMEQIEEVKS